MRKILLIPGFFVVLLSCNSEGTKTASDTMATDSPTKANLNLPFEPLYSGSFTDDVSDADLAMVIGTYKDWQDGNSSGLEAILADSVDYDASNGFSKKLPKADLIGMWKTYRDSLSSVKIDMYAWRKMYAADKKEGHIVTWYKEIDTYKDGRVDSATYHDINGVKDGKMVWYSSMKRGFVK
jgi:hypothetical protein